ncbi:MAG: carboxypeptidase-like regulatory domain-containing protein, partial [Flavobacteriaceae bacterium]|nr:carboxypeptidase-like regulatory domain-containing protein [Flavobacteriaceae bacterium]
MIRRLQLAILLIFISNSVFSQVIGTVTDTGNQLLPYVNIYTEDGLKGTTTNEEGSYELKLTQPGNYTLIFQFLGYESLRKQVKIESFPYKLDVILTPEITNLEEVTVNADENPADKIIRNAIDNRRKNLAKIEQYTADYYSRGLWRIKNAPEKILGQEIGDLGGGLDSTRSGIVYLSETISEITYKAPDDFKEKILASKVSGNDNGFSLNSAQESDFTFYRNTVDINAKIVSPIAD